MLITKSIHISRPTHIKVLLAIVAVLENLERQILSIVKRERICVRMNKWMGGGKIGWRVGQGEGEYYRRPPLPLHVNWIGRVFYTMA